MIFRYLLWTFSLPFKNHYNATDDKVRKMNLHKHSIKGWSCDWVGIWIQSWVCHAFMCRTLLSKYHFPSPQKRVSQQQPQGFTILISCLLWKQLQWKVPAEDIFLLKLSSTRNVKRNEIGKTINGLYISVNYNMGYN